MLDAPQILRLLIHVRLASAEKHDNSYYNKQVLTVKISIRTKIKALMATVITPRTIASFPQTSSDHRAAVVSSNISISRNSRPQWACKAATVISYQSRCLLLNSPPGFSRRRCTPLASRNRHLHFHSNVAIPFPHLNLARGKPRLNVWTGPQAPR